MIADWAEKKKRNIVFKVHPADPTPEVSEAVDARIEDSLCLFRRSGNIHALIQSSLGVAVINSGTGFESLIHGKPVAAYGDCDYKWTSFAMTAGNLDEVDEYFLNYSKEQKMNSYRFLYHYICRHAFETIGNLDDHLRTRVKAVVQQAIDDYQAEQGTPDRASQDTPPDSTGIQTSRPANSSKSVP